MTSLNDKDFIRSIAKVWRSADAAGIGEQISTPTSLKPSAEFIEIALDECARYEDLYLTGLRFRDYNVLLSDYSFFQFSMSGNCWRLAYYPNPFFGASADAMAEIGIHHEMLTEGIIDMDTFLQEISEMWAPKPPPLLRYDYDPSGYVELNHPSSHLHIGQHTENRWPLARVMTPEAFGLMVMRLYYSGPWNSAKEQPFGKKTASLDDIYVAAKAGCRALNPDEFSDDEKRHFFLS